MRFDKNLLVAVYAAAGSQYENFTTEALVFLLNRLRSIRFDLFAELVSVLTAGQYTPEEISSAPAVTSQSNTEVGRPDIEVSSADVLIYIEVKTGSPLGPSQLQRYRTALDQSGKSTKLLLLLSRRAHDVSGPLDGAVRWMTIGRLIQLQASSCQIGSEERFLLEQVSGFLEYRRLLVNPPTSDVSTGLASYLERTSPKSIFDIGRVRSYERFDEVEELAALGNLLQSMESAVRNVHPNAKIKLDSGKRSWQGPAWVGLNVNSKHFFFVYLDNPDVVQVESWRPPVDPGKADGQPGNVAPAHGDFVWFDTIDLQDPEVGFYMKSPEEKALILEGFYRQSLEVLESIQR